MKKILTLLAAATLTVGCVQRLQVDAFSSLREASVFSDATFKQLNLGGVQNHAYEFLLNFNDNERGKIKAVVWELENGLGEVIKSKFDLTNAETGEWPSGFAFKWNTDGLLSDDYTLKITVYDKYAKTADGSYSFIEADYKRTLLFSFFIGLPEGSTEILMVSLKAEHDTGISDSDRVTMTNKGLTFTGKTNLADSILQKEGTTVKMKIEGIDEGNKGKNWTSENLNTGEPAPGEDESTDPEVTEALAEGGEVTPESGETVTEKTWEWTTPQETTLEDGKYSVKLEVQYKAEDGATKTESSSNPFIVTIDTQKPELYWRYLYKDSQLVGNSEKAPEEEGAEIYEVNWDFIDVFKGKPNEEQQTNFERLGAFDAKDYSEIFPLQGESIVYKGSNFPANEKGFEPYCAGTQQLQVRGRDKAGNIAEEITRKLTVKAPHTIDALDNFEHKDNPNHQMYNEGFNKKEGLGGDGDVGTSSDSSGLVKGALPGWNAEVYYHSQWLGGSGHYQVDTKNIQTKAAQIIDSELFSRADWGRRNAIYTQNNGDLKERVVRFAGYYDCPGMTGKFLCCVSGFVYKTVFFYQGVTYQVSGKALKNKRNGIDQKISIAAKTADSSMGDTLEGGGPASDYYEFKFNEGRRTGYHYRHFQDMVGNLAMIATPLEVKCLKSGLVQVGFSKQHYKDSDWAVFDDLDITFTYPQVKNN